MVDPPVVVDVCGLSLPPVLPPEDELDELDEEELEEDEEDDEDELDPPVLVEVDPPEVEVEVEPPDVVVDTTTLPPLDPPPPKKPPKKPPPKPPRPPPPMTTGALPPPLTIGCGGGGGIYCGTGAITISGCSQHSFLMTRRMRLVWRGASARLTSRLIGMRLSFLTCFTLRYSVFVAGVSATWTAPPPTTAQPAAQADNLARAIRTDISSALFCGHP